MSKAGQPFDGGDFAEACEDCNAPAGVLCYSGCPSGYSADTRERHAEVIEKNARTQQPT